MSAPPLTKEATESNYGFIQAILKQDFETFKFSQVCAEIITRLELSN